MTYSFDFILNTLNVYFVTHTVHCPVTQIISPKSIPWSLLHIAQKASKTMRLNSQDNFSINKSAFNKHIGIRTFQISDEVNST